MKRNPSRKTKRLDSPCPICGEEIETVWMKDGAVRAVQAKRATAIFSNMANADGREILVWIPHTHDDE